jgi:hypothetical protein
LIAEVTIRARVGSRVPLSGGLDPLQPLALAPQFPQPMYAALAALSPEWMLPGISNVKPDTAAGLQTNPRFVEAFLVGLNQEFSHELLWREVPADLTATFFRTFWGGTTGAGPAPDTPPVKEFDPAGHLGDHTADHSAGGRQVLLIRAELLRRYPNAMISAVRAKWRGDGHTRELGDVRLWPVFRGQIGSDITFFGFDITDDPRGADNSAAGYAGWYFIIEEHVTAPRFGLEPKPPDTPDASWNGVAWTDVTVPNGFLSPTSPPSPPEREGVAWGAGAAQMAYILMRRPVRVAMHGRALIGPGGQ